jgi:hypothetical protein
MGRSPRPFATALKTNFTESQKAKLSEDGVHSSVRPPGTSLSLHHLREAQGHDLNEIKVVTHQPVEH